MPRNKPTLRTDPTDVSRRFLSLLARFGVARRYLADKGSRPPDEWPEIDEEYVECRDALCCYVAKLEMRVAEEKTPQGIAYDWWVTGPRGAHYELRPIKGKHLDEDIRQARKWLRQNFDVESIKVKWKRES